MSFPRNSLRAFLQHARTSLVKALNDGQNVNIVVGNESADLDSLTSSLLFAYVRSIVPPRNAFAPIYIPLVNIPSSGLRLRPEFTAVCAHANISPSSLLTLDDFPFHDCPPKNLRFVLVDHNRLQGELGRKYASSINGVIDHHEEENAVPQGTEPEPRIIEKCGSCTSLVLRYCRSSWDSVSSSSLAAGATHGQREASLDDISVAQGWDAQIAKMALASILIDTANLTARGKVKDVDREAVEYLETKINMSPKYGMSWSRDRYYNEIDQAKKSIDPLTLGEILQKDYKQWTENGLNLGISSVVKSLDYLAKKGIADDEEPAFDEKVMHFMKSHELTLFSIMTIFSSSEGELKRELLVQAKEDGRPTLQAFVKRAVSTFQLEAIQVDDITSQENLKLGSTWRKIWLQKDVSQSRKQVAPMLRECMMAQMDPTRVQTAVRYEGLRRAETMRTRALRPCKRNICERVIAANRPNSLGGQEITSSLKNTMRLKNIRKSEKSQ